MRTLVLLLLTMVPAVTAFGQADLLQSVADTSSLVPAGTDSGATLLYLEGEAAFNKRDYALSEAKFRQVFAIRKDEETARFLYYSLSYQGLDLEAEAFQQHNRDFTFALPHWKQGFETIYADGGLRASSNDNAGDIFYGSAGITHRPANATRLWSAISFLQHDNRQHAYQQYQTFITLTRCTGSGWYLRPALHYAYVPYRLRQESRSEFSYSDEFDPGPGDPIRSLTSGTQVAGITSPGRSHYLNGALGLSKRIGSFTFDVEPAVHYISGRSDILIAYTSTGTTTELRGDDTIGSKPYSGQGYSFRDTSYRSLHGQAAIGITYRFAVFGQPITIRGSVFGIGRGAARLATAYHASATFWYRSTARAYMSWLRKGDAPLALHSEGLYFNYFDPIETRATASLQLFPLRFFSPALTYQYEQGTRTSDGAKLLYHSFYVTLKFNL